MAAKPVVAVVVISFDCCLLDRSVHSLNLTVGPGMVRFGQATLDPIGLADHIKAHLWKGEAVAIARLLGELNTVVGQDRVNAVWRGLQKVLREFQAVLQLALSTGCATANLPVRSMATKR